MQLFYFAWVRTGLGCGGEQLSPPPEVARVGQLLAWLRTRSPRHAAVLGSSGVIRVAVNQVHAGDDTPVGADDEVALFPPVCGG